jgi:hypothetical protein
MGLFQRSTAGAHAGGASVPDSSADADHVARARDHFSALPVPERAAEILVMIGPAIEQADDYMGMRQLLAPWLPDADWTNWPAQQRTSWFSLELDLQEAFQALELARMLIRRESPYKGATDSVTEGQLSADPGSRVGTGQCRQLIKQPVRVIPGAEHRPVHRDGRCDGQVTGGGQLKVGRQLNRARRGPPLPGRDHRRGVLVRPGQVEVGHGGRRGPGRKVSDVTTPKLPAPAPRGAQNRSPSWWSSQAATRPSASTTCAPARWSSVSP